MFGIFGTINDPFGSAGLNSSTLVGQGASGIVVIGNSLVKLVIVAAGLYTFWNFLMAGYGFMSAGGEPKNIAKAWEKIWQSLLGLLVTAGSFVLAVIVGYLVFGPENAMILISPQIF